MSAAQTGLYVVANFGADADDLELALSELREHTDVEVVRTRDETECADCIVRLDGRRLVVAGGDGTLSSMVTAVRRSGKLRDVVLGLLPLGTGNDFARTLGIPLDPRAAARVIVDGNVRVLDLLVDDGGATIVNAVHAGIGADAAEAGAPLKDILGPLAYPVGAAAAGISNSAAPIRVHVDGDLVFDGEALLVGVGNGRTVGGGTPLVPAAEPDDGVLDVVVVAAQTLGRKVGFVRALRSGEHTGRDDVASFRGFEVRIEGAPLRYDADGELSSDRTAARFTVEPRAWTMIAPPR